MATTRAEHERERPVVAWGLTIVNSLKGKAAQHKQKLPFLKLGWALLALIVTMMLYITYVNKASTDGYFYKVERNKVDEIKFAYNLVKLDVLERQQTIWRVTHENSDDTRTDRDQVIIVSRNKPEPETSALSTGTVLSGDESAQ
jgi:hypothetical protein